MAWKFDPALVDIVWTQTMGDIVQDAVVDSGLLFDEGSDLMIDLGERTNDVSAIDQGERFIDGNS